MVPSIRSALVSASLLTLLATAACGRRPHYIGGDEAPQPRDGQVLVATIPTTDAAPAEKVANVKPVSAVTNPPKAALPKAKSFVDVAASRSKNVLAAWTTTEVEISADGGKTFHTALGGAGRVDKVVVDARGVVYAVRHGKDLGVRSTEGLTRWHTIPGARQTYSLAAGAGVVAWVGTREVGKAEVIPSVALSKDQGETWSFPAMPGVGLGAFSNEVLVEDDGTLRVMTSHEADCGGGFQARFVGKVGSDEWKSVDWPLDTPGNWGLGAGGWAYGLGSCEDGPADHLCAAGPDGKGHAVKGTPDKGLKSLALITDGKSAWGTVDGKLASFTGDTVFFPAGGTPAGLAVRALDSEGMPVGVVRGKVMRWSRLGHWQPLFAPAPVSA